MSGCIYVCMHGIRLATRLGKSWLEIPSLFRHLRAWDDVCAQQVVFQLSSWCMV